MISGSGAEVRGLEDAAVNAAELHTGGHDKPAPTFRSALAPEPAAADPKPPLAAAPAPEPAPDPATADPPRPADDAAPDPATADPPRPAAARHGAGSAPEPNVRLPPAGPPPFRAAPPPRTAGIGRGTVAAIAAAVAAVAFLAGFAAAGPLADPSAATNDDLAAMIGELRGDLAAPNMPAAAAPPARPAASTTTTAAAEALSDDDPAKGDPDAPLVIVEFSDFQCPFCGRFYEQTLPLLERDYIDTGKARLVYRDMPLESIHPQAPAAHIAAECAGDQGMFWEYHDLLFDRQGEWSRLQPAALEGALAGYAGELGLDSTFAECVRSPEAAREMQLDLAQALGMGLTGTPTFLIGGNGHDFVAISGAQPYSTFASILDGML